MFGRETNYNFSGSAKNDTWTNAFRMGFIQGAREEAAQEQPGFRRMPEKAGTRNPQNLTDQGFVLFPMGFKVTF